MLVNVEFETAKLPVLKIAPPSLALFELNELELIVNVFVNWLFMMAPPPPDLSVALLFSNIEFLISFKLAFKVKVSLRTSLVTIAPPAILAWLFVNFPLIEEISPAFTIAPP